MKIAITLVSILLSAGPALAKAPSAVTVSRPWIAAPPSGAPTAAGYAVIKNVGRTPDTFLGAMTPAAEKFQLHTMSMTGGVMRMRPVTEGVVLAPGQTLTLAPGGGYHFMVVGPKHPLKVGDKIQAVLNFAKAGAIKTTFVVQPAGGMTMR
jgi:copper(I)-binding protein